MSYGGDPRTAKIIKDIPIWAFHGSKDPVIPVRTTRNMINALRNAGGNPLYTEVPGGGHEIWDSVYAEPQLYQWLFAQHQLSAARMVPHGLRAQLRVAAPLNRSARTSNI
jgi:predicted peptidase